MLSKELFQETLTPGLNTLYSSLPQSTLAQDALEALVLRAQTEVWPSTFPWADLAFEAIGYFEKLQSPIRIAKKESGLLLDLGGGDGFPVEASSLGFTTYICIDLYRSFNCDVTLFGFPARHVEVENLELWYVKADILAFLNHIERSSCSVVVGGIDTCVIPELLYHEALADELCRVITPHGIAFGAKSTSLDLLKNSTKFPRFKNVMNLGSISFLHGEST